MLVYFNFVISGITLMWVQLCLTFFLGSVGSGSILWTSESVEFKCSASWRKQACCSSWALPHLKDIVQNTNKKVSFLYSSCFGWTFLNTYIDQSNFWFWPSGNNSHVVSFKRWGMKPWMIPATASRLHKAILFIGLHFLGSRQPEKTITAKD